MHPVTVSMIDAICWECIYVSALLTRALWHTKKARSQKGWCTFNMSTSYDGSLLVHLAEHIMNLSASSSFWFSLNSSYDHCCHLSKHLVWWQPTVLAFTKDGASPSRYWSENSSLRGLCLWQPTVQAQIESRKIWMHTSTECLQRIKSRLHIYVRICDLAI